MANRYGSILDIIRRQRQIELAIEVLKKAVDGPIRRYHVVLSGLSNEGLRQVIPIVP